MPNTALALLDTWLNRRSPQGINRRAAVFSRPDRVVAQSQTAAPGALSPSRSCRHGCAIGTKN